MVDSSTQHPSETQDVIARVLGIPRNLVTVRCLRMGGAFGGKEVQADPGPRSPRSAHGKKAAGARPSSRALDMALTGKRHPFHARFDAGFENDGRLRGRGTGTLLRWRLEPRPLRPVLWRALFHCDNAYLIPALDATGYVARRIKHRRRRPRFRRPQGMLVIEEILDRIARTLGIRPI